MTTDNRTNEQIVAHVLSFATDRDGSTCEEYAEGVVYALRTAGRLAGEPTPEQVEAAAKAMHGTRNPWFAAYGDWGAAGFEIKKAFRDSARAALVAAAGAEPQAESEHEYLLKARELHQTNSGLPSSTVDEGKWRDVAKSVIERRPYSEETRREIRGLENAIARAVVEAIGGEGA